MKALRNAPVNERHGIRHVRRIEIYGGKLHPGPQLANLRLRPVQGEPPLLHAPRNLKFAALIEPGAVKNCRQRQGKHDRQPNHKVFFHRPAKPPIQPTDTPWITGQRKNPCLLYPGFFNSMKKPEFSAEARKISRPIHYGISDSYSRAQRRKVSHETPDFLRPCGQDAASKAR